MFVICIKLHWDRPMIYMHVLVSSSPNSAMASCYDQIQPLSGCVASVLSKAYTPEKTITKVSGWQPVFISDPHQVACELTQCVLEIIFHGQNGWVSIYVDWLKMLHRLCCPWTSRCENLASHTASIVKTWLPGWIQRAPVSRGGLLGGLSVH